MSLADQIYVISLYKLPWVSLSVFVAGASYRILKMLFLHRRSVKAEPRKRPLRKLVVKLPKLFIDPIVFSLKNKRADFVFGLTFLHFLGILPILFLLSQHVAIWSYYLSPYKIIAKVGLWIPKEHGKVQPSVTPGFLPETYFGENIWDKLHLTLLLNGFVLSILAIIGAIGKFIIKIKEALEDKYRHLRLGDFTNYILLISVLATGFVAATFTSSLSPETYKLILSMHVMLAEILFAIIPFSRFWHFVFGYWYGKLHEYYSLTLRRGVV